MLDLMNNDAFSLDRPLKKAGGMSGLSDDPAEALPLRSTPHFADQASAFAQAIVSVQQPVFASDAGHGGKHSLSTALSSASASQRSLPGLPARPTSALVSSLPVAAAVATTVKTPSTVVVAATTGAAKSTAGALPTWASKIVTASIARDLSSAISTGTVTESGLATMMTNLVSTLTTSKSTLTAQHFNDLKTIATNLSTMGTTSSYINYVFNALVNGHSANATWTGGAASSVKLGNLATGSTAAQLSNLTGKWLLGTDTPSSAVKVGSSNYKISYSIASKPLFATSGPAMTDINQGGLGDCYFLASCAEIASHNADLLKSMFTDNGNGTYGVRFYSNGKPQYVTVNAQLANGGSTFDHSSTSLWGQLAEKAWAQFQAGGIATGNTKVNYGNSYSTIGNGGYATNALAALTGATAFTEYYGNGSSWSAYTRNASLVYTGAQSGLTTASIQSSLISALNAGYNVVLSSYTNAKDAQNKTTLVSSHAMSIYGFNSDTNMFKVYNPWGTAGASQSWRTTFEVGLSTLLAAKDVISVDNVSAAVSSVASVASKLTSSIASLTSSDAATATLANVSSTSPRIELANAA
ncbi:C2 family cysteine protease [Rhizobium sp. SGZ-381]|uniref:C2 family cysteine protease n=1 Tax=Rhizobium sp. SGZ-381 TaxID=3342800 RepID=UPI003670D0B5